MPETDQLALCTVCSISDFVCISTCLFVNNHAMQGYLVDECGLSIADACEGVALAQKLIAFEHCLKVWLITHTLQSSKQ
jgi:hypothetical protein